LPTITNRRTKRSVSYNVAGREYNLIAAIRSSIDNDDQEPRGLEGDVAAVLGEGTDPTRTRGFAAPLDALVPNRRALSTTTGSGAIPSRLAPTGSWTDVLRGKAALGRLGAEFIPIAASDQPVLFPAKTSSATAGWVGEGDDLAPGDVAVAPDSTPYKTVGAGCVISRKMLASVDDDVLLDYIAAELAGGAAYELDRAAFVGAGGLEPVGFFNASAGIPVYPLGTNGLAPTRAALIAVMKTVHAANGDAPASARMGWAAGINAEAKLRSVDGSTGGAGAWLWDDADKVLGKPAVATTGIPDTFAKGSGTGLSGLIYGNFADVLVVHAPTVQIVVDPITLLTKGAVRVFAFLDVHVVVRHAASFCLVKDMVTA
jgi:HK97 family phage major capsid protein